ncbi:tetratricopeptide repeat protein [Jatrophihabitans sp.]|uniref:co-chaperone YbbN n=1 Tax=Jatrophihabitans sp. TaxID=1932789 RepID=UPI0030C75087|nr:Thioredoxin [Jatrophihabitans sp.]
MSEKLMGMRPGVPRRPTAPAASAGLSAAMAGAVDLAAVKARNEAAARAAEAPPPAPGEYVVAVTEANFQGEVLDRSFQLPVILGVTSTRATGADVLMADLESIAVRAGGAFLLAEIDADQNPRIAQALQLRAIPAVFAVISGQLVPGFEGAPPIEQIAEFVAAVLQAARDSGMQVAEPGAADGEDAEAPEAAAPEDPRFDAAEAALADGDYALAKERFQAILSAEPGNTEAALALRQVDLLARVEGTDPELAARADSSPDDVEANLAAADLQLLGEDIDGALRRLLDLIVRVSGPERDAVRTRLVDYFDILGPDDPRVDPARREMARALF